jgi:hypothetical protein
MNEIIITLTDTQLKGLSHVALDPQEWIQNAADNRARQANDEIVDLTVKHCLDNGIQIPTSREAIVTYAFDNGLVITAAEQQQQFLASKPMSGAE